MPLSQERRMKPLTLKLKASLGLRVPGHLQHGPKPGPRVSKSSRCFFLDPSRRVSLLEPGSLQRPCF